MTDQKDVRDKVANLVAKTAPVDLTAARLDEIVLEATGLDGNLATLFKDAKETRFTIEQRAQVVQNREDALGCVGMLAVLVAAAAAGGVFGRYGQSPGWTWMPPVLNPIAAACIVLVAVASFVRPAHQKVSGTSTIAFVLLAASGALTLLAPGGSHRENVSLVASMAAAGIALIWIHLTRARRARVACDIDLAFLHARREARTALVHEREKATRELDRRLRGTDANLKDLETLWDHAAGCAQERGVSGLERAPGPVGTSWLAATLDIPRDDDDRSDEQAEAAWKRRSVG